MIADDPHSRDSDKHRQLNVVSTHSMVSTHVEGEVPAGLLPSSLTQGLALVGMLAGSGYEDLAKPDAVVDVCFEDPGLESASPGYGSPIEVEGLFTRPPVIPVLQSCVAAVDTVVEQLSGEQSEVPFGVRRVRNSGRQLAMHSYELDSRGKVGDHQIQTSRRVSSRRRSAEHPTQ